MAHFEFDGTGERVLRCPTGVAPVKHRPNRTGTVTQACFSKALCAACPLRAQCPTKERSDYRVLEWSDADFATIRRRIEQETPEFKELHKGRSAIEGTNSELKRCHGLRKLRVRTEPRVSLSVRLKALALNLKRYVAPLTKTALAPASPQAICAC